MSADVVWLIELPEQWSWLPLWSPGKIPRKYIQPAAIGSSFAMPASSLEANGIMASSAWDTSSRSSPSAVNKQPHQIIPVAKPPAATMSRIVGRGYATVRLHWMTVKDAQNNPSIPPAPVFLSLVQLDPLCQTPAPLHHNLWRRMCFSPSPFGFSLKLQKLGARAC